MPGSGLRGSAYVRHTRAEATSDDDVSGRWVAVDESGWDGEQLYGRGDRYLVLGSVAFDDAAAAPLVEALRRDAGLSQPPELKFGQFAGSRNTGRLEALAAFLLGVRGRASAYLVDKHYFVVSKMIDLLLEERVRRFGGDLHAGGAARSLARTLFDDGPRALGQERFERLIATMVDFASGRNRGGVLVTPDVLVGEIDDAWARARRRKVADILGELRRTRSEAVDLVRLLGHEDGLPVLEPLIPSLNVCASDWCEALGRVSVLVDEQRVYTDERLDRIRVATSVRPGPLGGVVRTPESRGVQAVLRGGSQDHPSIQLADLVAGAGREVARRHVGRRPSPAGELLWRAVVPLISAHSLVPHDEPERFGRAGTGG